LNWSFKQFNCFARSNRLRISAELPGWVSLSKHCAQYFFGHQRNPLLKALNNSMRKLLLPNDFLAKLPTLFGQ
jgi:hypothetical protein